ncbi:MAG: DUF4974 domain-containing protein [Flavobacteriales bacterium]|nr:DUF4974 domain-containing protein [Flavobacteriales bacterium]
MIEWNEHIDDLIALELTSEISASDEQVLIEWLNLDATNSAYYAQMQKVFSLEPVAMKLDEVQINRAWQNVKNQIGQQGKVIPLRRAFSFYRAVAAVAVLILASFLVFRYLHHNEEVTFASAERVVTKFIPGGSEVVLNRESEIVFEDDEDADERKVKLTGEAFFKVNSADNAKLIVEVSDLLIRDIGTSFNVRALSGADTIYVAVIEGKVQMFTADLSGIELSAGQSGFYVKSTKVFQKDVQSDENAIAFVDKKFRFRNTSLKKAAKKLSEVYQREVILDSSLIEDCRVSVQFNNDSLINVLNILSETLGIRWKEVNGKFILYGDGCGNVGM